MFDFPHEAAPWESDAVLCMVVDTIYEKKNIG